MKILCAVQPALLSIFHLSHVRELANLKVTLVTHKNLLMNGTRLHHLEHLDAFGYLCECEVTLVCEGCVYELGCIALVFIGVGKLSIHHLHICQLVLTHIKPAEVLHVFEVGDGKLAIFYAILANVEKLNDLKMHLCNSIFYLGTHDVSMIQ